MPVPGTMTSVSWETLQDPTLVFGIPVIGYRLPDGSYLENSQLEPDIKVANSPETVVKGEDTQLKAAVDELLKEIDGNKEKKIQKPEEENLSFSFRFLFLSIKEILFFLFGNHQIIILLPALNQQVFSVQQISSCNYLVKGI